MSLISTLNKKELVTNTADIQVYTDVGIIGLIDIESVNPYDEHHFPFGDKRWKDLESKYPDEDVTEKHHLEGIEYAKKKLKDGDIIRPILVFNGLRKDIMYEFKDDVNWDKIHYQRLDGFKRYMAMKDLGVKWIVVHVVNTWVGGGQVNQSMFL